MSKYNGAGCPADLGAHDSLECVGEIRLGGISAILVCLTGYKAYITSFSNGTQVLAAIAAKRAYVINKIKGELPASSVVEVENPYACGPDNIPIGKNFSFTAEDDNVIDDNDTFYGLQETASIEALAAVECSEGKLLVAEPTGLITFVATTTIPKSDKQKQMYKLDYKWYMRIGGYPYTTDVPAGVFE